MDLIKPIKNSVFQLLHGIKKTFTEASYINNIHTEENVFCSCYSRRFVRPFFSERVKKIVVDFGLYEFFSYFCVILYQVKTVLKKQI